MPRTAVWVDPSFGRLRQCQVGRPTFLDGRGAVDGGAHQRMPEGHAIADRQEPVRFLVDRRDRDPDQLGRTQQQPRIADRLRRREQQQTPRVDRERIESLDEALLDSPGESSRIDQAEASGQLRRRQPARQLQQGERVPARLRDDPVADLLVQVEPDRRAQQRAGIAVAHPTHLEVGDVLEVFARLARSEHDPDRLGEEATGDEGQRQRRGVIEPLCVIDDAQERTSLRSLREQAQHPQPDQEPVGGSARAETEHGLQGLPLRGRERREASQRAVRTAAAGSRTRAPCPTARPRPEGR